MEFPEPRLSHRIFDNFPNSKLVKNRDFLRSRGFSLDVPPVTLGGTSASYTEG